MKTADYQDSGNGLLRSDAETTRSTALKKRSNAADIRSDAQPTNVVVNLAQINFNTVVVSNTFSYKNGAFIPVFQDAMRAFACNADVKPGTRRVLEYILGTVDENNCFSEELMDIADNLGCSVDTVERGLSQLIQMQIICKKAGARNRSRYELSDKILNPRMGFKGNTRKLSKNDLPLLLEPKEGTPLIPSFNTDPDF